MCPTRPSQPRTLATSRSARAGDSSVTGVALLRLDLVSTARYLTRLRVILISAHGHPDSLPGKL
eukprot:scaffold1061_cov213-Prasinococcus_capsulatus_cf.AAC.3